ncbi:thermonuclease family protein [Candidatus Riflebacteria bacterium]
MRINYEAFFWGIIIYLFCTSTFFTIRVTLFKKKLTSAGKKFELKSGTGVKFERAIDGDEIAVSHENQNFIVRILGIKSFDPTVNESGIAVIARQGLAYLDNGLKGKNLVLNFTKFTRDKKNRVLAYVESDGIDIGLQMVKKGITVVYTLHPFSRMDNYLSLEKQAMKASTGLWGNKETKKRALAWQISWVKKTEK